MWVCDSSKNAHESKNHFSLCFTLLFFRVSTSRLPDVCMTNNSYQEWDVEDYDCPFLEDFHCKEGRKAIRFWRLKVRTMDGMAQKTNGVLCWIYNNIIPLDRYCWDLWKSWTQQVHQQLVSLLYSLLLWNVRPPRNMCGEIEYIDLGWMNGVMCHDIFKNNMPVLRSSPHLRLLRSSPHLRLLRECSQSSGHVC